MESLRRRYKITLEEEDKISARVEAIFKGIFSLRSKENIAGLVEDFLNRKNIQKGDVLGFTYNHNMTYEALLGLLGDIRAKAGKNKKKVTKKKSAKK
jgi:hypothetical protein